MTILTKDEFFKTGELQKEEVEIPEGKVIVRELTAEERSIIEESVFDEKDKKVSIKRYKCRVVAFSVVDKEGKNLFTEEDIEALQKKSAVTIEKIYRVCARLSKMRAEDIKELEKN